MLPLGLLNASQNRPMLVETKDGETYNGHLVECDTFMNLFLREAYRTSASGQQFWKVPEIYIRGSVIKYIRVPEAVVDRVKEQEAEQQKARAQANHHRGGSKGQRGDHRGGSRGGRGGSRGRGRGGRGGSGNAFS